jgi:hypothetical protein
MSQIFLTILTISQSSHQLIEKPPIYEPPLTPSSEMTTIHQHQRLKNQENVHERESVAKGFNQDGVQLPGGSSTDQRCNLSTPNK